VTAVLSYRDRRGWTGPELRDTEFPPTRWAVPGLIAEGLNLLVGPPKVGKSYLILDAAVSVASGGVVLGTIPVDQGEVLYIALEDGPRRIKQRIEQLGHGWPEDLHVYTEWSTGRQAVLDVYEWLTDHPAAALVIVDTYGRIKGPAARGGQSSYDTDTAALAGWQTMATSCRVPVVMLHHDRKAGAEDFVDAVSGTHGIAGVADTTILLERTRMESVGTLKITGRDVEEAEYAIRREGFRWELTDGPVRDPNLGDLSARIIAAVARCPAGARSRLLAVQLNEDEPTVRRYLVRLADSGRLVKKDRGLYAVPLSLSVSSVTSVPFHPRGSS
jgi:hypothetical protein